MAEKELQTFREKWRKEIKEKVDHCRINKSDTLAVNSACNVILGESVENISNEKNKMKPKHETCKKWNIAHDGRKRQRPEINQPNSLMTLEIPSYQEQQRHVNHSLNDSNKQIIECTSHHHHNEDVLSLLIKDIDETCAIPFFDISLPREECINIFNYLDTADLCHCACVSKTWASIANDDLLWCKLYERLGLEKTKKNNVDDISWKCIVKNGILKRRLVERNWKERICQIQTFEYEKGGMLTACGLIEDILIAGYANGKTCLWNVESNWQSSLAASAEAIQNPSNASVECVTVLGDICAAAFSSGMINVWHTTISLEPIYQYHAVAAANHIALTSFNDAPLLLTLCGERVRVDHVNNNGQWQFVHSRTFEEKVRYIELLHDHERSLFALALKEEIFIYDAILNSPTQLDRIAGTKITSMTCVENLLAVGWAPYGFGLGTNFTAKVHIYDTTSRRYLATYLNNYAEITTLNLFLAEGLVTGSTDKQVRIYDLRCDVPQISLRGHTSAVTTVQMDSWKTISGAFDGTLKVWDLRLGNVLWETRASHPVRLGQFENDRLVTANIPVDKIPYINMWYADDLIQHRRHRGSIHVYHFGNEAGLVAPEEMRSNYDDIAGYNYNINLVAPYDSLTSEIRS